MLGLMFPWRSWAGTVVPQKPGCPGRSALPAPTCPGTSTGSPATPGPLSSKRVPCHWSQGEAAPTGATFKLLVGRPESKPLTTQ